MNTLAFKNDGFISTLFQPHYIEICKRSEQQIILRELSKALNKSLKTYQQCLTELQKESKNEVFEKVRGIQSERVEIVIESDDLYIEPQQNKAYITEQIDLIVKTEKQCHIDLQMGNQNQSGNSQLQKVKIDHQTLEIPITDFKLKKKYHKRTSRGSTSDQSNNEEKVTKKAGKKTPEVNFIEDCDIPNFSFLNEDLQEKKEELLKRKVDCWPENTRHRKHKRQLRNLE